MGWGVKDEGYLEEGKRRGSRERIRGEGGLVSRRRRKRRRRGGRRRSNKRQKGEGWLTSGLFQGHTDPVLIVLHS